jgi:transposase InsO family protein
MSKARLVITAIEVEGRSPAEVIAAYGVSRSWLYELLKRYRTEGNAAFEPRSRRPHTSPQATPAATVELVLRLRKQLTEAGLDAGADTIGWHLTHHHRLTLSRATVHRILAKHGAVVPDPAKRPKSSYIRSAGEQPNETWQSDFTHYRLTRPDGSPGADVEIITWLDDHSRLVLHCTAHPRITGPIALATFRQAADLHGYPGSTLTDNGTVYTTRFAGGRGGRTGLEAEPARLGIVQKNSRPGHPTTCGKVERVQQTLKKCSPLNPTSPPPSTSCKPCSIASSPSTTSAAPTGRCLSGRPRRPPTPPVPKPAPAPTVTATTAFAPTRSTKPAASPSALPDACTTSASDEPTPEPTS